MSRLRAHPPFEKWQEWVEYDPRQWPKKVEKRYRLVPTVCFNCEAACGIVAYVDKETGEIKKFEGHPLHPASRGRNCAKGPATQAQVTNPDRILYPLKRTGARGGGQWRRVSWDQVLDEVARRIRQAILENRRDEVVYHVGRPGEDMYTERVLQCWGVDGHNSHTNVCSAGARLGYAAWMGIDRPSPDHADARFILLMSSHLESGHYFNPHAQRIIEAKKQGVKVAVIDTRLSNTASQSDLWLSPWPGTEAGLLLAIANLLIQRGWIDREFIRRWVNWEEYMPGQTFAAFLERLQELYAPYTPEWAAAECGVNPADLEFIAAEIHKAKTAWASHIWRGAAAAHLGGWMIARALFFLHVLTGSVATPGGVLPNTWTKFVPRPHTMPQPIKTWNEIHFPNEYPFAHFELSYLLPHLLAERKKKIDVYFTRVYNPVWTNPDGFSWIEMLTDPGRIGLHLALTPVWSETAQYADYVLPMGLASERHDLHSYETHAAQWIGFRQPVQRAIKELDGQRTGFTYETNPGEVWEENEFWLELSWRIDPDGSLGIRRHFESPYRPGQKLAIDEYYRYIFENSVPGLPAAAEKEGMAPLEYMRRKGAFEVTRDVFHEHERPVPAALLEKAEQDGGALWVQEQPPRVNFRPYPGPFKDAQGRFRVGILVDGKPVTGFPTPSGKLEFFSKTLHDWGWPEYAIPTYPKDAAERQRMPHITSHVHWQTIRWDESEFILLPTFRLPTLIHTRTNGAKWLYELSHMNPIWVNPVDAKKLGVETGDLVKLETEIGYFVDRVWVTEAIRPGVIACSHHLGRWRLQEDRGSDRWNSSLVRLGQTGTLWQMDLVKGPGPWQSEDPDSSRIWWSDGGVHQNLTFPVQPDPISGQHCWHQRVRVTKAAGEKYGTVQVDTAKAREAYRRWLGLTRPGPGPDGTRRPYWLLRPLKPHPDAYASGGES